MSDKNSSNKQRTFLFNLSYTCGNNQHKNNYEQLELIYQFYASAISKSNFVIENFKRCPPRSKQNTVLTEVPTYRGIQRAVTTQSTQDQDKDKKEEGDKQKDTKMSINQILMRLHRKNV